MASKAEWCKFTMSSLAKVIHRVEWHSAFIDYAMLIQLDWLARARRFKQG